jgi:ubiquinone/menaquinone biosynthesis C-methylase UbiE
MEDPWYLTLFERDWYDVLAPGGASARSEAFDEATSAEVDFIVETLALPAGAFLLDLCCGWGRHVIRLAQRGLTVAGQDLSAYHIELGRKQAEEAGVAVTWLEGDMRKIPLPDESVDAVINMFTAFGYFDDEGNQTVLEEVSRVLRPGGRFLLDVINRDNLMRIYRETDWRENEDGTFILERRRWDGLAGRIHAEWTIVDPQGGRRTRCHDERIYTLQELKLRLSGAGLKTVTTFGGCDGSDFERTSRRLIVLAEKG